MLNDTPGLHAFDLTQAPKLSNDVSTSSTNFFPKSKSKKTARPSRIPIQAAIVQSTFYGSTSKGSDQKFYLEWDNSGCVKLKQTKSTESGWPLVEFAFDDVSSSEATIAHTTKDLAGGFLLSMTLNQLPTVHGQIARSCKQIS
jgi:hypothetical protein